MTVYEFAGKSDKMSDLNLPVSGFFLLAAPSTSDEARNEVVRQAGLILPVCVGAQAFKNLHHPIHDLLV
jgi:hypothetical protein